MDKQDSNHAFGFSKTDPQFCECGDHAWAPLTRGYVTMVSPWDAVLLTVCWQAHINPNGSAYARRNVTQPSGLERVRLHRVIAAASDGEHVDHRNVNTLDNREANLRTCTISQNAMNRRRRSDSALKVKGVRISSVGRYSARIIVDRKQINLGTFPSIKEAQKAYMAAARKHFGEFASDGVRPMDKRR